MRKGLQRAQASGFWCWDRNDCLQQKSRRFCPFSRPAPPPANILKLLQIWMQCKLDQKRSPRKSKLHSSHSAHFWALALNPRHTAAHFCATIGCFRSQQVEVLGRRPRCLEERRQLRGTIALTCLFFCN